MGFPLSEEANELLAQWPARARELFEELIDDAGSDLQRELIQRAVVAAHSPAEVHAFADALRGMSDEEAYEACTLHDSAPEDYTVAQLLRAEADPLFAFELMGGNIEPNEEALGFVPPRRVAATIELESVGPSDVVAAAVAKKKSSDSFEAESPGQGRDDRIRRVGVDESGVVLQALLGVVEDIACPVDVLERHSDELSSCPLEALGPVFLDVRFTRRFVDAQ